MAEEIRDDLQSILIKEKNGYESGIMHNFTLPGELTVTITLSEYRKLVSNDANTKAIWDYYMENEKLKKENAALKEKLLKYMTEEPTESEKEEE